MTYLFNKHMHMLVCILIPELDLFNKIIVAAVVDEDGYHNEMQSPFEQCIHV